ncbi:glycosyltransferase family 2 protein [Brachybacterium huguangmaarense]
MSVKELARTRPQTPVTVVIPAYEAADTVRAAVDSVLAQTFGDFVLHIVDDGSTLAPVPEDLPDDPRVILERLSANGGYAHVTNHAVRAARSEWVTFVDADDVIAPTFLERMLAVGEATGADVVFSEIARIADGAILGNTGTMPAQESSDALTAVRAIMSGGIEPSQHVLLRRPRPCAIEGQTYSDFPFVLEHTVAARRVGYVQEPLYHYTVRPESVTGRLRPQVWDLVAIDDAVAPILVAAFGPEEARRLGQAHRDLTRSHILHAAAKEREDSPLLREVTAWCRSGITPAGMVRLVRAGHPLFAVSWAIAKVSPPLHRRVFRAYDRWRRSRPRQPAGQAG